MRLPSNMQHLKLLLIAVLSSQLAGCAVGLHDDHKAAPGAVHTDVSRGGSVPVEWGLSKQGESPTSHTTRTGFSGPLQRSLQQSSGVAGRVVGWGTISIPNYVPSDVLNQGATDIAIISGPNDGGPSTFLALLTNQSVVTWGVGVGIPAKGAANVTAIAANTFAAAVLLSNGTVAAIADAAGRTVVPQVAQANVDALWAGANWFFSRLRNGSFVVWDWATSSVNISQPRNSSEHVVDVAAGYPLVTGSMLSGLPTCWLSLRANGSVIPEHGVSVVPSVLQSGVVAIAGSNNDKTPFLALLSNGSIVQWSYTSPDKLTDVLFPFNNTDLKFVSVASPNWAITTTGTVVSWDIWSLNDTSSTVPLSVQDGIVKIVDSFDMTLAMKKPGPLNVVGFNGQVIAPANDSIPAGVSTAVITQVAAGTQHAIALQVDGRVVVWGAGSNGPLSVPTALASGGVKQVAAASDYCMAVTLQGDLYAWGTERSDGSSVVVPKEARYNVKKVAAGDGCAAALLNSGSVIVWGIQAESLSAIPAAARANIADIAIGGCATAIAALKNGSIVQWGDISTTPELENVTSVATSNQWNAAVLKNGSLVMLPRWNTTEPIPKSQQRFVRGLHVQRVALGDCAPLGSAVAVCPLSLVLLVNGTLTSVPFWGSLDPIPAAAQSGVIDMAIGGTFFLAVTKSSTSLAPTAPTINATQTASISFIVSFSATSNLTSNTTLKHQFTQQLITALATYFNVSTEGVAVAVSNGTQSAVAAQLQSRRLQQAPPHIPRLLQSTSIQMAPLNVSVNITASWQASDTATPAFLRQQVSQIQQQPATAIPAALSQAYGLDTRNVTISGLRISGLLQTVATPTPSLSPVQNQSSDGMAVPSPGIATSAPSRSKKLSKGAIAGLTAGCVIGALAVATMTVVMYKRYKPSSTSSGIIIPPLRGGFQGAAAYEDNVKIAGLPQGELFVLATAQNYTWVETSTLSGPLQAVEAGVNDTQLDRMLQKATETQQAAAPLYCPAVQLSKDEICQQVQLLSDGLLGRGATALVFKCVWPSRFGPSALLAAKVLHNGFESDMAVLSSFAYEANLLAGIQHPHVVKLYGYCLDPPTVCLILELLPCSLKDVLYEIPSQVASTHAANSLAGSNAVNNTASSSHPMSKHGMQKPTSPASQTRSNVSVPTSPDSYAPTTSNSAPGTSPSAADIDQHANSELIGNGLNVTATSKEGGHPVRLATLPQIVSLCTEIAAGLAHLHSQPAPDATITRRDSIVSTAATRDGRIVHRDMKPANILLNSQGVAKISDFGLARQHDHTTFATINLGAGTLPYMAPELLISSRAGVSGAACTNRVDIYSLGIIMWELLMGQPPWKGMAPAAIMAAVIHKRRLPLPGDVQCEDREHAIMDVPLLQSLPAHSHPDMPKMCQIIQACWQHRELRRPTAAALHGMLSALRQQLDSQQAMQ